MYVIQIMEITYHKCLPELGISVLSKVGFLCCTAVVRAMQPGPEILCFTHLCNTAHSSSMHTHLSSKLTFGCFHLLPPTTTCSLALVGLLACHTAVVQPPGPLCLSPASSPCWVWSSCTAASRLLRWCRPCQSQPCLAAGIAIPLVYNAL
jgi:hypothetical protein